MSLESSGNYRSTWTAEGAKVLTKSDSVVFPACRGVYVGGTGDVNVKMANGVNCLFSAVPAGQILPISIIQLLSTSTTATLVVALS